MMSKETQKETCKFKKNQHLLYSLLDANPKLTRAIINSADIGLIKALAEIGLNILKNNLKITDQQKEKFRKYKNVLRRISSKYLTNKKKRKLLTQKGSSIIPLLISTLLSSAWSTLIKQ